MEEIRFFAPQLNTHLLPDWETLPYDHFSPHPDLVSERLSALHQISQRNCDIMLVPVSTALMRLPPQSYLAARTFMLKKGDKLDLEALREQCAKAGYSHVTQVVSPGAYDRFARLGVIASMQPSHLLTDMAWAGQRLGLERRADPHATESGAQPEFRR